MSRAVGFYGVFFVIFVAIPGVLVWVVAGVVMQRPVLEIVGLWLVVSSLTWQLWRRYQRRRLEQTPPLHMQTTAPASQEPLAATLASARRILDAEAQDGCRDRVVIGGLAGFVPNFVKQIGTVGAGADLTENSASLLGLLHDYGDLDPVTRSTRLDLAKAIITRMANEHAMTSVERNMTAAVTREAPSEHVSSPPSTTDLMAALEASLSSARARTSNPPTGEPPTVARQTRVIHGQESARSSVTTFGRVVATIWLLILAGLGARWWFGNSAVMLSAAGPYVFAGILFPAMWVWVLLASNSWYTPLGLIAVVWSGAIRGKAWLAVVLVPAAIELLFGLIGSGFFPVVIDPSSGKTYLRVIPFL